MLLFEYIFKKLITRHTIIWFYIFSTFLYANEKVLHVGDFGKAHSLVPGINAKAIENRICQFIFDSLVVQKRDNEYTLSLAEEVDVSPDSLSYTFLLKENLKWQDSVPLTARDVEFTLEILLNKESDNYSSVLAKFIDDVTFVNPQTLTITLTRPYYEPLSLFTFKILPKHLFKKNYLKKSDAFVKKPIGCGPFTYSEGLDSETIVLERNPYFNYRSKPFFSKVIFKTYKNFSIAKKALLKGKIHILAEFSPLAIDKNNDIKYVKNTENAIYFLRFNDNAKNNYHEIFSDTLFRRALSDIIDKKSIAISSFYREKPENYNAISGPFPQKSWFYNSDVKISSYNFANAKNKLNEILLKHGYQYQDKKWKKAGESLTLKLVYDKDNIITYTELNKILNVFNEVGIHLDLQTTYSSNADISYEKYIFKDTTSLLDLVTKGESFNTFRLYSNSKFSELLHELYMTLNPWALKEISQKIHMFLYNEAVFIFLWQLDSYVAYNKQMKNVQLHPLYSFNFPDQWKFVSN